MSFLDEYEIQTGRKLAGLRGDSREKLDTLLTYELSGTGIGRSAFICAAVDFFINNFSDDTQKQFISLAESYERLLP